MYQKNEEEFNVDKFEGQKDKIPLTPLLYGRVEVDFNEIRFRYLMYTVVIPKQTAIYYKFCDQKRTLGLLALKVKADSMEIRTRMGIFGKIFGKISYMSVLLDEKFATSNDCKSPATVYSIKEIKNFLYALKRNDYRVDFELDQLQSLIYDYIPPKRGLPHKAIFGCLFIWGYFTLVWLVPLIVGYYSPSWGFPTFIALIIGFPVVLILARIQNERFSKRK